MSLSVVKSHNDLKEINSMINSLSLHKDKRFSMADVLVIDMSEPKNNNNFSHKLEQSLTKKEEKKNISAKKNKI